MFSFSRSPNAGVGASRVGTDYTVRDPAATSNILRGNRLYIAGSVSHNLRNILRHSFITVSIHISYNERGIVNET